MSRNDSLSQIPIIVEPANSGMRFHWRRRLTQFLFIAIAIIIPVSGLLRIDLVTGAFVVLDRQIWWADFFLIFGLWMLLASGMVMLYSTVGTAFCGWACPQNTLSEIANEWTYRLLGKRADVSVSGDRMKVAASKNRFINWLLLGLILLAMSMLLAFIPLFYFYPPDVIWSFVTFRDDERLADSLHYIYFICMLVVLVDVSFIRHFWCRFMCVYRVWQHGFKTHQTLKLAYDESRAAQCEKCNYCSTVCFIGLDPRNTDMYDSCINCGECVDACNTLQAKKGESGLLSFTKGATETHKSKRNLASMSLRMRWTLPFSALGLGMFIWGLVSYDYYHLAVYRADQQFATSIRDYRIAVSNKLYRNAELKVSIEGIAADKYSLSDNVARFDSAGRIDLMLHMKPNVPPGLHSFLVHVNAMDGWHTAYRVQHFVEKTPL
ncbi:MAG: 4Fe-4S dicluster domain-containing protein [Gammaproteobacteria bacterium]|nr:4Fe-4S dicluster domain-containing protein [Gammaproteobacteria bacterium]